MTAESIEFGSANSIPSMSRNDQKSFDEDPNFFMWIRNDGLLRDEGKWLSFLTSCKYSLLN